MNELLSALFTQAYLPPTPLLPPHDDSLRQEPQCGQRLPPHPPHSPHVKARHHVVESDHRHAEGLREVYIIVGVFFLGGGRELLPKIIKGHLVLLAQTTKAFRFLKRSVRDTRQAYYGY